MTIETLSKARLRVLRENLFLSVADLAEISGESAEDIARWEDPTNDERPPQSFWEFLFNEDIDLIANIITLGQSVEDMQLPGKPRIIPIHTENMRTYANKDTRLLDAAALWLGCYGLGEGKHVRYTSDIDDEFREVSKLTLNAFATILGVGAKPLADMAKVSPSKMKKWLEPTELQFAPEFVLDIIGLHIVNAVSEALETAASVEAQNNGSKYFALDYLHLGSDKASKEDPAGHISNLKARIALTELTNSGCNAGIAYATETIDSLGALGIDYLKEEDLSFFKPKESELSHASNFYKINIEDTEGGEGAAPVDPEGDTPDTAHQKADSNSFKLWMILA